MDETLIRRAAALACVLTVCLSQGAATAATGAGVAAAALPDPTRPPAVLVASPTGTSGVNGTPMLQSVQIGHARSRSAVIDGESVRVGEQFRGARVMRIADTEVELQRGGERQVLRLYTAPEGGITRVKGTQ